MEENLCEYRYSAESDKEILEHPQLGFLPANFHRLEDLQKCLHCPATRDYAKQISCVYFSPGARPKSDRLKKAAQAADSAGA